MTNPPNKGKSVAAKFLHSLVDYNRPRCVIWPFSRPTGYGMLVHNGKSFYAHRFMCEIAHGPAPTPQHQAAHSCGNGHNGCVNPRHLSWQTNSENQLERRRHGTNGTRSKLTPEQVLEIRRLKGVKSELELAKMFGVSRSTIQYRWGGYFKHRSLKDRQPGG